MEDLETQRKYKSVRMRLGYDWNTNRKKGEKDAAAQQNQISHSVCSIDSRHFCAVVLQYRNLNGENSTGRNFHHRESTGRHERKDPVGDPFSPDTGGSNSRWSTGTGRVAASDLFPQSHSRTFRLRNFFRGEDGSGTGDGIFAGEYDPG